MKNNRIILIIALITAISVFFAFDLGQYLTLEYFKSRQAVIDSYRLGYPEAVLGDPVYGTQKNRRYLKGHGIRFAGKPLGRPKKVTEANREELKRLKAQRRKEYLQRIPIEGKFGQGKNGYRLNYIRAKRAVPLGSPRPRWY